MLDFKLFNNIVKYLKLYFINKGSMSKNNIVGDYILYFNIMLHICIYVQNNVYLKKRVVCPFLICIFGSKFVNEPSFLNIDCLNKSTVHFKM